MTEKHYIGAHDGAGEQLPAPQHELQALDRPRLTAKPNSEALDDRDRPAASRGRMFEHRMWADGQYAAARGSHGARSLRSWRTRSPARRPPPRPTRSVAGLVASIAVLIALTGVAQSPPWRPAAMSTAAYRALMLRSQALNRIYHLGAYSLIPPAMPEPQPRLRSSASTRCTGTPGQNRRRNVEVKTERRGRLPRVAETRRSERVGVERDIDGPQRIVPSHDRHGLSHPATTQR